MESDRPSFDSATATATSPASPMRDPSGDLLDQLQTAVGGGPVLDAALNDLFSRAGHCGLRGGACLAAAGGGCMLRSAPDTSAARWSEDLAALLGRIPGDYNFSIGERDGVQWAWMQPNDDWTPGRNEMRHDHPRGSGLVVAHTMPLALASALVSILERNAATQGESGCFGNAAFEDRPEAVG